MKLNDDNSVRMCMLYRVIYEMKLSISYYLCPSRELLDTTSGYECLPNPFRSIVELNSILPFHCTRSIVKLTIMRYLQWFLLVFPPYLLCSSCFWTVNIEDFWKINLYQAVWIPKRNLDCWRLRILPSYSFCYSVLSTRSHWQHCKVKPKKNRGTGQMLYRKLVLWK
jgi:hypothetical protein